MDKSEMITILETKIEQALLSGNDSKYAINTIANSRGTIAAIKNPPKGTNTIISENDFNRIVWDLNNVIRGNKI